MRIIEDMLESLQKVYPDETINIFNIYSKYPRFKHSIKQWCLIVGNKLYNEKTFEGLVKIVRKLTNTDIPLEIREKTIQEADPFLRFEPSPENGNYRGD